jgi:hypothetical protein
VIERLPFDIERVYYLHHIDPKATRGGHAHRELRRLMIAICGGFSLTIRDRKGYRDIRMDDPTTGLLIDPLEWLELHEFTPDAVVLVLASAEHDETDCIRDFAEFKRLAR